VADLFLKLLNMAIAAGWMVLAVFALRFLLKKAPKALVCVLWALVGIRLICPFSFESVLSLIPSRETLPAAVLTEPTFDIHSGFEAIDRPVNDYLGDRYAESVTVPAENGVDTMTVLAAVWLIGVLLMALYTAVSYGYLKRKVREGVRVQEDVYLCDRIETPFILGLIRPKIYLPSSMGEADMAHVLAHERAHLSRHDHWWKPLGFALLSVYWFHPLLWVAYVFFCRDIELATDEKVIGRMDAEGKKAYSHALINCSAKRRAVTACPLAFGEVGVKERIRSVLHYKKPTLWLILLAVIVCIAVALCFLTDPKEDETYPDRYYLVVGGDGVERIEVTSADQSGGVVNADGSPFRKGEKVWLEVLDGESEILHITAYDADGRILYEYGKDTESEDWKLFFGDQEVLPPSETEEITPSFTSDPSDAQSLPIDVSDDIHADAAVLARALKLVQKHIDDYNAYGQSQKEITGTTYHITKAEILSLEQINTGTSGLTDGINLYRMSCRLKPYLSTNDLSKILLAGGMRLEDGWFYIDQPYFAMHRKETDGETVWTDLGAIDELTIQTEYATDDMLSRYGDPYTAAAMELYAKHTQKEGIPGQPDEPIVDPPHESENQEIGEEQTIPLTDSNALAFIREALGTLTVHENDTVSFSLPKTLPKSEDGKTKLTVSLSATFKEAYGVYGRQRLIDNLTDWKGGEVFSGKLDTSLGEPMDIMLRLAFAEDLGNNTVRTVVSDYIELTAPFAYGKTSEINEQTVLASVDGGKASLLYTFKDGSEVRLAFDLPDGLAIPTGLYRGENGLLPSVTIGIPNAAASITMLFFGTDDREVLENIDTADNTLPMPIFSPIALSSHSSYTNYTVKKSTATSASAVVDHLWLNTQAHTEEKGISVLAYDYNVTNQFVKIQFADGTISNEQANAIAESLILERVK